MNRSISWRKRGQFHILPESVGWYKCEITSFGTMVKTSVGPRPKLSGLIFLITIKVNETEKN